MIAGTMFELKHLSLSMRIDPPTEEAQEPKGQPEEAPEAAQDSVSLSPKSQGLLGPRVQLDLEMTSIRVVQGLFSNGDQKNDPSGPLKRFAGILRQAADASGLDKPKDAPAVPDFLAKLRDFFSPEKTAGRIFDFAVKHYGQGSFTGADDAAQRTRYRDFVLPAIQQGFDAARAEMGKLPDSVSAEVNKTFDLLRRRFEQFVTNGLPQDQAAPEQSVATSALESQP